MNHAGRDARTDLGVTPAESRLCRRPGVAPDGQEKHHIDEDEGHGVSCAAPGILARHPGLNHKRQEICEQDHQTPLLKECRNGHIENRFGNRERYHQPPMSKRYRTRHIEKTIRSRGSEIESAWNTVRPATAALIQRPPSARVT